MAQILICSLFFFIGVLLGLGVGFFLWAPHITIDGEEVTRRVAENLIELQEKKMS